MYSNECILLIKKSGKENNVFMFDMSFYRCFLQIDHQVKSSLQMVEDVLGKGWESHIDGQQLKQDGESFRLKLESYSQALFDEWKNVNLIKQPEGQGKVLQIATLTGTLQVNFAEEAVNLIKEVCVIVYVDSVYVCVCICVYMYGDSVCMCVCVCVYMYVDSVCVCVCASTPYCAPNHFHTSCNW